MVWVRKVRLGWIKGKGKGNEKKKDITTTCAMPLVCKPETSPKCIICATLLPVSLSDVGNEAIWAVNSTVTHTGQCCHVSMAYREGPTRHLHC